MPPIRADGRRPWLPWAAGLVLLAVLVAAAGRGGVLRAKPLRVCADPNNLPFSNRAGEGFENRLAELVARDLGRRLEYVWWAQHRGYVRNTLNAGACDLWPGVASGLDMLATTRPYYRSSYVFVTRADARLGGLTLDDPRLRRLRLGVQLVGDDADNTPPAHALAARGIVANVRGYMVTGDYREANPPAAVVKAVERGEIDVSLAWGPMAGYFAQKAKVPLRLEPVTPWLDRMRWPMAYDISMGVQKRDEALRRKLDTVLARRRGDIDAILARHGVPVAE